MQHSITQILSPAYDPCPGFSGACKKEMRWDPKTGHVPRGFLGATGSIDEVDLVLVVAEPGNPHKSESHSGIESAYHYATNCVEHGKDQFHRNIRRILDSCWPGMKFHDQLRKTWITESVLCSATKECGNISTAISYECGQRYLLKQISLFRNAVIVALGSKAKTRLKALGFDNFYAAGAIAPPGCNQQKIQESWKKIPEILRTHKENLLATISRL